MTFITFAHHAHLLAHMGWTIWHIAGQLWGVKPPAGVL